MTIARDLAARLADLLHREHAAMADFLLALADFDRRKLWSDLGHSSLFYFLHRELGLSKGAAFYRKIAVELVQRFPDQFTGNGRREGTRARGPLAHDLISIPERSGGA